MRINFQLQEKPRWENWKKFSSRQERLKCKTN
jgi:hypothetical protein